MWVPPSEATPDPELWLCSSGATREPNNPVFESLSDYTIRQGFYDIGKQAKSYIVSEFMVLIPIPFTIVGIYA